MPEPLDLTRENVQAAYEIIKPHVHRTPVLTSNSLNEIASNPQDPDALKGTPWESQRPARPKLSLFFKCENFQKVGAFKARGAYHAIGRLSDEEAKNGVCTHSSGNHAQALAHAARTRGIPAHIVMPTISTPSKIAATRGYGANVFLSGSTAEEREAVAADVMAKTHARMIPPYDHPDIILGQGTVGLEFEQQVDEILTEQAGQGHSATNGHTQTTHRLDAVISPVGGGGLLAGIATSLYQPTNAKDGTGSKPWVYGAEPSYQGGDDIARGLSSSPPLRITSVSTLTIADGLRTPAGEINWTIVSDKRKVRGCFGVNEEQIKAALRLLMERLKVFIEPSAAVGFAVCLFDETFRRECEEGMKEAGRDLWKVGIVLTGGNTTVEAIVGIFGKSETGTDNGGASASREETPKEKREN